ncbi:hypothetical protein GKE82_24280 [Conexibacter sp. W3-3-2]|uniref:hypothetical protein n=1 Tax=Conexibacter sp. W3-3-2 TaxID=2675227 RepID=UPI0012B77CE2|nr:hypothetical protein [Conexibacter sp. W3-3-2]MTD47327.1 hypothetical protein [Conexibacter sp. W3-3-2]
MRATVGVFASAVALILATSGCGEQNFPATCSEAARSAGNPPGSEDFNKEARLCEETLECLQDAECLKA